MGLCIILYSLFLRRRKKSFDVVSSRANLGENVSKDSASCNEDLFLVFAQIKIEESCGRICGFAKGHKKPVGNKAEMRNGEDEINTDLYVFGPRNGEVLVVRFKIFYQKPPPIGFEAIRGHQFEQRLFSMSSVP